MKIIILRAVVQSWNFADFDLYIGGETGKLINVGFPQCKTIIIPLLFYTCQLFLRDKRENFILGVLGFLKTTRSFLRIPEEVRSLPKTSEVSRRRSFHLLFTSKIRGHEEGIVTYSFYTWFSFLTWVWVNMFLEIVSSKTATTHIFQSGVRNWPASVSRREIEVFNPQAWELAGIKKGE